MREKIEPLRARRADECHIVSELYLKLEDLRLQLQVMDTLRASAKETLRDFQKLSWDNKTVDFEPAIQKLIKAYKMTIAQINVLNLRVRLTKRRIKLHQRKVSQTDDKIGETVTLLFHTS